MKPCRCAFVWCSFGPVSLLSASQLAFLVRADGVVALSHQTAHLEVLDSGLTWLQMIVVIVVIGRWTNFISRA